MKLTGFLSKLLNRNKFTEQRRHPRFENVKLRFKVLDPEYKTDLLEKAEMVNISAGGCCFVSTVWVPKKSHLLVVIGLDDQTSHAKIDIISEAVRVTQLEEDLYEIAVRFFSFTNSDQARMLEQYLESF